MSGLRVSTLRGATAGSSPTLPDGVIVTGVTTATSFAGALTGNVTGNVVGNVTGDVTGNIAGTAGTFSGNVSVGGTLTYEDVTNVDSVGVITARSGIRIGVGQSISAVSGIITYYGDGSQLSGVESGVGNFVASGTIANGATVVINTDGTVGIVTQTTVSTSAGTPAVFESANANYISAIYDSTNEKVVIIYQDVGNSYYGTAVVGTVSGASISFGTPVVFESASTYYISSTYDSTNGKVVIAYTDNGNSSYGTAIVGTVSGTSISFGTAVVFESASTAYTTSTFDSTNGKVVIAYRDSGNSDYGTAIVGTVSGTSISFGSAVVFESAESLNYSATFDSTNGKVVIAYRDEGNSAYGTAIVGTVSGTSISFGTAVVFNSSSYTANISATFDSTNGKVVIAYKNPGNSNYGTAIVGTVSGTSISFGTAVVFNSAITGYISATYNSTNQKISIAYNDEGNSEYGTAIVGTVSGTSISFGSEVVFESAQTNWIAQTYDSDNNKVVIVYSDAGNSSYGTAVVFTTGGSSTNLTSENYIGIAAEAISNGATGKINILGGTNTGQTGLTTAQTYYVQTNGTLATSAGSPSVVAGDSISDTKILIR